MLMHLRGARSLGVFVLVVSILYFAYFFYGGDAFGLGVSVRVVSDGEREKHESTQGQGQDNTSPPPPRPSPSTAPAAKPKPDKCARFGPANDMLVVVKTGATEIHAKLPVHFSTTLKCIPHFVVFSDAAESIEGYEVHDVLASVSDETKATNKDFAFYRTLQEQQRSGHNVSAIEGDVRKMAWELDKWKFLPMMDLALSLAPAKNVQTKWFFFIEADTAVVWSNIFTLLSRFDASKPLYIGGPTWIGDVEFAHGGTGWVMSRPAVEAVARLWREKREEMERLVGDSANWAGERALAVVLKEHLKEKVGLTRAWPIFQGETPDTLDYTERHWCFPVGTYHHVDAGWVRRIWAFGEEWAGQHPDGKKDPMRHRDAFAHFVRPHLSAEKRHWGNLSPGDPVPKPSADECRKACEAKPECMQWSFHDGKCKMGDVVRLGKSTEGGEEKEKGEMVSGWMTERVKAFEERLSGCNDRDYWVP